MENRRCCVRQAISVNVKITHSEIGERIVETKNISDTGLFVIVNPKDMPEVGEIVQGQVQGMHYEAPIVKMRIVRIERDGLALEFIAFNGDDEKGENNEGNKAS
ncbi:PilZ domain-containing protein [Teredinibacter sp. KSP-S5-2]|uniref:PilZ domain-containing protein n=1 Tax=Teredinibacter sp. KSP-S5-2 TaxID=3034506 RepID=UPI002934C4CE|nr:PilZ domain-containing protein [Teredinibacter sp. KSP-S5-2]WNO11538.1 PilZ domain-containing protein [Teredinibacter sp. KSP-S5-2]